MMSIQAGLQNSYSELVDVQKAIQLQLLGLLDQMQHLSRGKSVLGEAPAPLRNIRPPHDLIRSYQAPMVVLPPFPTLSSQNLMAMSHEVGSESVSGLVEKELPTWQQFIESVYERFEGKDPGAVLGEFNTLRQCTKFVEQYSETFEELKSHVMIFHSNFPESYYVTCFINGLCPDIKGPIIFLSPIRLHQAVALAKNQEAAISAILQLANPNSKPWPNPKQLSAPKPTHNSMSPKLHHPPPKPMPRKLNPQVPIRRILTEPKMQARRKAAMHGEDDGDSTEPLPADNCLYQRLKVKGVAYGHEIHILIDGGSTHCFLDIDTASKLGCALEQTVPLVISLADGREMISQWPSIHLSYEDFNTERMSHGARRRLVMTLQPRRGFQALTQRAELRMLSARRMSKLVNAGTYVFVGQLHAISAHPPSHNKLITQQDDLSKLLADFFDIFQEPQGLPPVRQIEHRILLKQDVVPKKMHPYRYSYAQKSKIKAIVKGMLKDGIIRPSQSSFGSPILLVKKKEDTSRMCVDYRYLNNLTIKHTFPIPVIDELLDELQGACYFSKIDLRSGFVAHQGHYEFLVMPFGLCNAPSTFQSLMNVVFAPYLRKFILVFFDDILVYSGIWNDHLKHLCITLELLKDNQLYAKRSKCNFGKKTIEYLGHIITKEGVKFIKRYGIISKPLTELLRKDGFKWTEEAAAAFEKLKLAMATAPVLALPDFTKTFIVETDACDKGIGAVLMQEQQPITYISKALSPRNRGLSVYEKEFLAILQAINKWKHYLKWIAKLLGLDYEIQYKRRQENRAADALSRGEQIECSTITVVIPNWVTEVQQSYKNNDELRSILQAKAVQDASYPAYELQGGILRKNRRIYVGKGTRLRDKIINVLHDSAIGGHSGINGTYQRVKSMFHWPLMKEDVVRWVQSCDVCQRSMAEHVPYPGLLQPLTIPSQAWASISMDFIEGLPKSEGKDCTFVVVDRLTKYAHFLALTHPFSAETVARIFMDHIYKLHGLPANIVSNRDKIFTGSFWKELFRLLGTTLSLSTTYHPQTDGQTERVNQCVEYNGVSG
ncbi:UNVERIFIED_CONTAM: Retrovirus-related Pol polyprotein from transposon 17.6 [Sesamum indicum]